MQDLNPRPKPTEPEEPKLLNGRTSLKIKKRPRGYYVHCLYKGRRMPAAGPAKTYAEAVKLRNEVRADIRRIMREADELRAATFEDHAA